MRGGTDATSELLHQIDGVGSNARGGRRRMRGGQWSPEYVEQSLKDYANTNYKSGGPTARQHT